MLAISSYSSGVQRNAIVLLRLRALFSHGILFAPQLGERVGDLRALGREKVHVAVCDVDRLVAYALGDVEGGEAHVDEQAHMAVAKVVDTYPLDARRLAAAVHLVHEEVLRETEEPLVGRHVIAHLDELRHLVAEERRHLDRAHRLARLRLRDHVLAAQPLVGLVYAQLRRLQQEVRGRERHELAAAYAHPVEHFERVEGERLVGDGLGEAEVLVLGPELHLAGLLAAHLVHLVDGVLLQVVVALGVIEDGVELVVDDPQVSGLEAVAVWPRGPREGVLPPDDVDGPYVAHAHVAKERQELALDDALLGEPGVLADPRPHLRLVDLAEVGEGHVHGVVLEGLEVLLPKKRLELGLEPLLRLVPLGPARVAVVELRVEETCLLVLIGWHR